MPKRYRQLQVNDLPKVPTWWLEWDSNLRPFSRKALTLPMLQYTPQTFRKEPIFWVFHHAPEPVVESYEEVL